MEDDAIKMNKFNKRMAGLFVTEFMTDFKYVIGGYLMKKVCDKEGMKGLFEALQAG